YRTIAGKWWSFVAFGPNTRAGGVLRRFGLARDAASAERLERALQAQRAQLVVRQMLEQLTPAGAGAAPAGRAELLAAADAHGRAVKLLVAARTAGEAALAPIAAAMRGEAVADGVLAALRAAPARAEAISALTSALREAQLFSSGWLNDR